MWVWGRPKRDLPEVDYAELTSDKEDLEEGLDFRNHSPLTSPKRPLQSREGSPVGQVQGGPTLADNVDNELEEVQWRLNDIAEARNNIEELTDTLEKTDTKVGTGKTEIDEVVDNLPASVTDEDLVEGLVVGDPESKEAQAEVPVIMPEGDVVAPVPYDTATGEDGEDAYKKLSSIKMPFCTQDPKYWFNNFERKLKNCEVKSQRAKKDALHEQLPKAVEDEVKNLLRLGEDEEGPQPYKDLKVRLLSLYQPKPEDAFDRAMSRVMTGKPSTLARQIINDICDCRIPLGSSCCARQVFGMWRRSLPVHVKAHISNQVFTSTTYETVLQIADNVYASHKSSSSSTSAPTVAAVAAPMSGTGAQATTGVQQSVNPQSGQQVAAFQSQGHGRGNRGGRGNQAQGQNRGGNRGSGSTRGGNFNRGQRGNQGSRGGQSGQGGEGHPVHQGRRHHSQPPLECCRTHWVFGGQA